jgi:hypothetical protein
VKPVPEAALGAVRDTLREHGEPIVAGPGQAMTFMQARTANEVLKAQERRVRLQRMKGELVDRAKAVAQVCGVDAAYTPAGGEPIPVRVIARRPDTIVGFGDTRIHTETAAFEVRASEVASPRPAGQLALYGET